ncbi:hypothetical protein DCO57_21865 [Labrenzia sp. 011]|nr:hypothetical protein DCO57_21865 [Labrenzia sp. 011]
MAIKNAKRPLQRIELLNAIKELGVDVGGKDPAATLATVVWRDKNKFVNLKGFGYWLVSEPFAPAHYDPSSNDTKGAKANLF